ncbi:putative endonuclease containing a URI domain [Leptolyngbya sp. PCC 7375]|nr:putative endonuclease containing a URI domain [Leptolyngbya sp. PCC 7375]
MLKCVDDSYYTGSTWNLERRLAQHQRGEGARHTAKRLPVELVYCEEYDRVEDAFKREKQIQRWSRKKKEALIAGDMNELHRLAECRNKSHSAGFDSAHPAIDSLQQGSGQAAHPAIDSRSLSEPTRSLSEVEGNNAEALPL